MPFDLSPLLPHVPAWLMVLFRLTGIFVLAPVLGSSTVPRLVKVMLVAALSLAVYPVLHDPARPSAAVMQGFMSEGGGIDLWAMAPMVGFELLVGFAIGLCASLPLVGMQMGGHLIEQQMGLGFANIVNPELNASSGVLSQFYFLMALSIFLIVGGHEAVFAILMGSFDAVPPGGPMDFDGLLVMVVGMFQVMFEVAFRIAAPLLCLIFAETLAMGFIARTLPQMNILSIGFIVRILVGLVFLVTTLSAAAGVFEEVMVDTLRRLMGFFGGWGLGTRG